MRNGKRIAIDNMLAFIGGILFFGLGIHLLDTNMLGFIIGILLILLSILGMIGLMGIKGFLAFIFVIILFIGLMELITSDTGQKILGYGLMGIVIIVFILMLIGSLDL